MKKRTIVITALAAACVLALAGCGKTAKAEQVGTIGQPQTFKGTITVAVPGGDYEAYLEQNVLPAFYKEYPNVKIIFNNVAAGVMLDTEVAAGNAPNVLVGTMGYQPVQFASMSRLVPLDKYPDFNTLSSQISPQFMEKQLGHNYYIPQGMITNMLIYNKVLFKEAGLDPNKPPVTYAEYLEDAKKISALPPMADGTKIYGNGFVNDWLSGGGWVWEMYDQIYYSMNNGVGLLNPQGTMIVFNQPQAKMLDFLTFLQQASQYAPASMSQGFVGRNIGMWTQFGNGWLQNLKLAKGGPMVVGQDVGIAPMPVLNAGDTSWSSLNGKAIMEFHTTAAQDAISWEFIKFMMQPQYELGLCENQELIPTMPSVQKNPFFQTAEFKPFVDQMAHGILPLDVPEADDIQEIVCNMISHVVVTKDMTPQQGINDAAAKSIAVFKENQ